MIVNKTKCDQCGKEVEDRYMEKDWIRIESPGGTCASISISVKRDDRGTAITRFYKFNFIDFCDIGCLTKWLRAIK